MFMGHLGVALAAKGVRKEVSLALLCVAAVAPDLIDFAVPARHGHGVGLWSHSIAAMLGYGFLFFLVYRLRKHSLAEAVLVGSVAASHVLLDLVTSRMVLWNGGPPVGLHLYMHRYADLLLECLVILLGWLWYVRTLPQQRKVSLPSIAILLVLWVMQGVMATMNVS